MENQGSTHLSYYLNLTIDFKAGCSESSRTTKLTKRLESRREALQRDYIKGDIEEREFLITIGSLTGKKVGQLRTPATGPEGTGKPLATEGPPAIGSEVISEQNGSLRLKINERFVT